MSVSESLGSIYIFPNEVPIWLCLNDSFLSIVEDFTSESNPRDLLVRARLKSHIEAVFPDAEVREGEGNDYRYRATVSREVVAQALSDRVMDLNYPNFKNSVKSKPLHDAYMEFWESMHRLQVRTN